MPKKCGKCKQVKDILEFSNNKSRKSGIHNECKECQIKYNRVYFIRKKYELSQKEVEEIIEKVKEGFCEICGEKLYLNKSGYALDHNHSTGQRRGLLCPECNKGIGHLKEDLYILTKAHNYIRKYS